MTENYSLNETEKCPPFNLVNYVIFWNCFISWNCCRKTTKYL